MSLKEFISSNKEKIKNIINTNTNKQTYRMIVLGRSGSGKSYWVKNFLEIENKKKDTVIFVLTPQHNKEYYQSISKHVMTEISNDSILFNIETILKFAEKYHSVFRIIILFDDVINEKLVNDTAFMNLFGRARHYNVNIIFIIQGYTRVVTPFMKNQATHYLLFSLNNPQTERQIIYDLIIPFCGDLEKSEKELFKEAVSIYKENVIGKKYGNILIDYNDQKILL